MMRGHPFPRPTAYTNQLGTGAILAAVGINFAIILAIGHFATRGFIVWP